MAFVSLARVLIIYVIGKTDFMKYIRAALALIDLHGKEGTILWKYGMPLVVQNLQRLVKLPCLNLN